MGNAVELPREEWTRYFDAVSHEMENSELSVEVARDRCPETQACHLALQFLAYDRRDELFEVAGESGFSRIPEVFHHLVEDPRRVLVNTRETNPTRIEVEARDGERTVITLGWSGEGTT